MMMMMMMMNAGGGGIQGGGRGDRVEPVTLPDQAPAPRPAQRGESGHGVHRNDADAYANPAPAAGDAENALPNCM